MKEFKHCFIIENGTYREISYTTLYIGTERNPAYADRYFLPLHGCLMEVPFEEYKKEYKQRRRCKYIQEEARLNGEVSVMRWRAKIRTAKKSSGISIRMWKMKPSCTLCVG